MLCWSLALMGIAVIAAWFGFGGIATGAAAMTQVLLWFLLLIIVVALMYGVGKGRESPASMT